MARIEPVSAMLGRTKSKKPIGYRIQTASRDVYQPFTTKGVKETNVPGFYTATAELPDSGGWIVWGERNADYAIGTIDPAPEPPAPPVDLQPILTAILAAVSTLKNELANVAPSLVAQIAIEKREAVAETEARLKAPPAEPPTLESLAARLEKAEEKNKKLLTVFGDFLEQLAKQPISQ